jgi:uncharacterized protein YkwD
LKFNPDQWKLRSRLTSTFLLAPSLLATSLALVTLLLLLVFSPLADAQKNQSTQRIQPEAQILLDSANRSRAEAGLAPLTWDPALTSAARQHCLRMAAEGPISHQYADEPDLTTRTAHSGAHFSLIEENVAAAPTPERVHAAWMHSKGHRENLLSPQINRVGIAVVASRGTLYAVADYARSVETLSHVQIEETVARLIRPTGISVLENKEVARKYCATDEHIHGQNSPGFLMRWQSAYLDQLPDALQRRIASGRYRSAAIGSCRPQGTEDSFTSYNVAVLLYE